MNKTLALSSALALVLAAGAEAHAYDSQCRAGNVRGTSMLLSLCGTGPFAGNPKCDEGLASVRGTQWGEHTYLAAQAMAVAGIGALADPGATATTSPVLDYYGAGQLVGGFETLEPAGAAKMLKREKLPITIPEFAQVPDMSYSLADFVLGNEHCPVANVPSATLADVASCHSFTSHMGPVNSTHFPPQARSVYALYHGLALDRAARCKALSDAFTNDPQAASGPLASYVTVTLLPACEKEALAYEAVASHFLADAWSMGHMWERWGSPRYPKQPLLQTALTTASLVAGLFHGWRLTVEDQVQALEDKVGTLDFIHDQLCMPGAWDLTSADPRDHVSVAFAYPSDPAHIYHGGGDAYLLPCTGRAASGSLAVAVSPGLRPQYDRMITCLARGMGEVYAAGPQTLGPAAAAVPFPAIGSSSDDQCWTQRATNLSMEAAQGASAHRDWTDRILGGLSRIKGLGDVDAVRIYHTTQLAAALKMSAAAHPKGTAMAGATLGPMVFFKPNSAYAHLIDEDKVGYLERHDPASWDLAADGGPCSNDAGCADRMYCRSDGRCAQLETADLRAFRKAEVATFCAADAPADLDALGAACALQGKGSDACAACAAVVLPHLRNACDADSYGFTTSGADGTQAVWDHRAACEVLTAAGSAPADPAAAYAPYDPTTATGAADAALALCLAGGPGKSGPPVSYAFESGPGFDARVLDPQGNNDFNDSRNTCGANHGAHWWRFAHPASPAHDHTFTVQVSPLNAPNGPHVSPADQLQLTLFQGPACVTPIGVGQVSASSGGVATALSVTWSIPDQTDDDVCVEVQATGYTAWTAYDFQLTGSEVTCSDGVQNGDETGVDCGGSCPQACATCSDGIRNGGERGVDCGGPCPTKCPLRYFDCTPNISFVCAHGPNGEILASTCLLVVNDSYDGIPGTPCLGQAYYCDGVNTGCNDE